MKNVNEQLNGGEFSDMQLNSGKTVGEEVAILRSESAGTIRNLRQQRDFKNKSAEELESEAKKTSTVLLGYLKDPKDPDHPNSLISQAKENREEADKIGRATQNRLNELKDSIVSQQDLLILNALENRLFNPLYRISNVLNKVSRENVLDEELLNIGVASVDDISKAELSAGLNSRFKFRGQLLSGEMVHKLYYLQDSIYNVKLKSGPYILARPLIEKIEQKITDSIEMALDNNPNFFEQNGNIGLSLLKSFQDKDKGERVVQIIDETVSVDTLNQLFNGDYNDLKTIDILLRFGSKKMRKIIEADIETYINENKGNLYRLIGTQPELKYATDLILHRVGNYVSSQYNVKDGFSLVKRWGTTTSISIEINLSTLKHLEELRPGAVKLLYEEYGICEFSRYPYEMLIDQVDNHGKDVPYGVLIYPSYDHNDAFDHNVGLLQKLYAGTKGKHINRVFEIESRTDFARALIKLDLKYKAKIDYMIFAAHGSEDSVTFGTGYAQGHLSIDLLDDSQSLSRVKEMFSPNPQIVLFSCSTGKENGIAQVISGKLQATVTAPAVATSPTNIQIDYKDGKPKFCVTYNALPEDHSTYKMGTK